MRGCSATTPPRRPPSAVTAACSTGSEIVVRTAGAWCGLVRLSTRAPGRRARRPGVPSRRSSKIRSRPDTPTSASAGTPSAASSSRRSGGIGPSWPTTCGRQQRGRGAVVALGQHGAVAGQQRGARRHLRHAAQALAGREPGEDERARPVDAVAGGGQHDLAGDGPERARGDAHRHAVGAAVLARLGRVDLRRRRGAQRVLVGGGEARAGEVVAIVRRSARSTSPRSRRAPTRPRSARRAPGRPACGGRRRRGRRRRPSRTPPARR